MHQARIITVVLFRCAYRVAPMKRIRDRDKLHIPLNYYDDLWGYSKECMLCDNAYTWECTHSGMCRDEAANRREHARFRAISLWNDRNCDGRNFGHDLRGFGKLKRYPWSFYEDRFVSAVRFVFVKCWLDEPIPRDICKCIPESTRFSMIWVR